MAEASAVAETQVHLIMLVRTGVGPETQWFMYKPGYFSEPTRVEWDKDTMSVSLPGDIADYLVRNGYARPMTEAEIEEYTAPPPPPAVEETKSTKRRGERG
jgi:hypothetical protein